jgi:ABC-2 type transport system permease protein
VLATATHRLGLAGSHLLIAIAVPVVMLAFSGLVTGIVHGLVSGDDLAAEAGRFTRAALLHAPAVWVVVGLSAALYGLVPRWSGVAWSGLAASFLLGQLGPMLQLPQWVMNLSPFTHVPAFPDVAVRPLLGLTAVAAALVAAGLAGFVRRDLV